MLLVMVLCCRSHCRITVDGDVQSINRCCSLFDLVVVTMLLTLLTVVVVVDVGMLTLLMSVMMLT